MEKGVVWCGYEKLKIKEKKDMHSYYLLGYGKVKRNMDGFHLTTGEKATMLLLSFSFII